MSQDKTLVIDGLVRLVHPDRTLDTTISFMEHGHRVEYEVLGGETRVDPWHVETMRLEGFVPAE